MANLAFTFDKRQYHLHPEREQWCRCNIGNGCWTWDTPKTWDGMGDKVWTIHSMFGNTTFSFKHEQDATAFALRWV